MNNQQMNPASVVRNEPQALRNRSQTQGPKDLAAQGKKLPSASRSPQTAAAQDHCDPPRAAMKAPDPMADPRNFWASVAGVTPDQLVFASGPGFFARGWIRWFGNRPWISAGPAHLLRLWRVFWFGPRHPDPPLLPPTPLNLAPWTNQILPDPRVTPAGSAIARLRDRLFWRLSHPATRYETHAWRYRVRANVQLVWRLKNLRNTLLGRPSGPPPWIDMPPAGAPVAPQQQVEGNEEYEP